MARKPRSKNLSSYIILRGVLVMVNKYMRDELKGVYLQKLARVQSLEEAMIEHLPIIVSYSSNEKLKAGLKNHLDETKAHQGRLIRILAEHECRTLKDPDRSFILKMEIDIKEVSEIKDKNVRDAAIIASLRTVEHMEIAKYGTLNDWARQLEDFLGVSLLIETLGEEKAADKMLSAIAEGGIFTTGINEMAAAK
jgi:ferritin-like metal-binding protein YciE